MIEKEVLIPTVLCDAGAKHEVLPELHDEDDMFEYTLTVINQFDKEKIIVNIDNLGYSSLPSSNDAPNLKICALNSKTNFIQQIKAIQHPSYI